MKTSFLSRFLTFTLTFYGGAVACIFMLTVIKTTVFFPTNFWHALLGWTQYDVFPVALAELFRSPLMGLLFAWLGNPHFTRRELISFGFCTGALSYGVAYFVMMLSLRYNDLNLTEDVILGLPVLLILISRYIPAKTPLPTKEN